MEPTVKDMLLLGTVTILGYYIGLVIKRLRLPSLIGYMLLGVLLGSSAAGFFDALELERLEFITEITLGFVAFMIGAELSIKSLKRQGFGIIAIIFSESFIAFSLVLTLVWLVTRDLPLALIFGAMAPASAPAGTVAIIQEYHARGSLTRAMYAVVGFDDGLAIIIFGFASALAHMLLVGEATGVHSSFLAAIAAPTLEIVLSLLVGGVLGFVFSFLIRRITQQRDYFLLVCGFILLAIGFSAWLHLSIILTNMVIGFVLVNTAREAVVQNILKQLRPSTPFLFILFFTLAGANLHISALPSMGIVGITYIFGRSAGLVGGAYIGAIIGKAEKKIRKYLGMGILSQAGVAIGLALIVKNDFTAIGSEHALDIGYSVITTVTATSIFFEIIGPILTKISLQKAGEINVSDAD
ncbi:cation:proton antiporter [Candidatus Latescibacterota bacterium]